MLFFQRSTKVSTAEMKFLPILLLLPVVEIHCQQMFPYVSFMNQTLSNHSYVDISQVGSVARSSGDVQCRTDLSTCCSGAEGIHRGDWYFPNGTMLTFPFGNIPLTEVRTAQMVVIRSVDATGPTGIYRCDIPTTAVHHSSEISLRDTVYIGLYTVEGGEHTQHTCIKLCNYCRACVLCACCFLKLLAKQHMKINI